MKRINTEKRKVIQLSISQAGTTPQRAISRAWDYLNIHKVCLPLWDEWAERKVAVFPAVKLRYLPDCRFHILVEQNERPPEDHTHNQAFHIASWWAGSLWFLPGLQQQRLMREYFWRNFIAWKSLADITKPPALRAWATWRW